MSKKRTKQEKIKSQKRKAKELENQKLKQESLIITVKISEYRKQEKGIKQNTNNIERQKEFERKQKKDGLKRVTFWLSNEMIELIEEQQKEHLKKHGIKLNKSKIFNNIFRKMIVR